MITEKNSNQPSRSKNQPSCPVRSSSTTPWSYVFSLPHVRTTRRRVFPFASFGVALSFQQAFLIPGKKPSRKEDQEMSVTPPVFSLTTCHVATTSCTIVPAPDASEPSMFEAARQELTTTWPALLHHSLSSLSPLPPSDFIGPSSLKSPSPGPVAPPF